MEMKMNEIVKGVTLTKVVKLSKDADDKKAGIHKTINLKIKYDGLTIQDVFMKALDKDVISWQNGAGGRKNYDNLKDNEIVEISASAPAKAPAVDPEQTVAAKLAGMSPEEQKKYFEELIAKAS